MTNSTTLAEKNEESIAARERADTVSDAFMVGVDREGRKHHFSRIRNCITVLDADGTHEHTQSLGERSLAAWMAFIDQEHGGWTETNTFSGSLVEQLCDQLATATGGDH